MTRKSILFRWQFVLSVVCLGALSCLYLSVSNDVLDLLPGEAVRGDIALLQEMGLVDRVFITLSVTDVVWEDPVQGKKSLQQSVVRLAKELERSRDFSFVLSRLPQRADGLFSSLRVSFPLLFDPGDLQTLETMTSPEGIQAGLERSFALLNGPAGIALKRRVQEDPLGMVSLILQKLNHLKSGFAMDIDDGFLMSRDGRSCLIIGESRHALTDSTGASKIQKVLNDSYERALEDGVDVKVIGSLPHTLANERLIGRDLRLLLPIATVLLILLLGFSLRNIRALVVLGVPFLAALPAVGLTGLIYGKISAIALGFGIVLLGIGVDFSIHLYLALTRGSGSRLENLITVRKPVVYASLTTSAVFIVLLFSEVVSHRQMATLALFGVLLAVLFSWLLIPTVVVRTQKNYATSGRSGPTGLSHIRAPKTILCMWLVLLMFGALSWPKLHYNGDLRVLDVADKGVIENERAFAATWGRRGEQAFIMVQGENMSALLNRNSMVYEFLIDGQIKNFQSIAPILPGPDTQENNLAQWQNFWQKKRPYFIEQFTTAALKQGFRKDAFVPFLTWLEAEPERISLNKYLQGPLRPLLSTMLKSPSQSIVDGVYLAMTTVNVDDKTLPLVLRLAQEMEGVSVLANNKWRTEVERMLRRDIFNLSLVAGILVLFLVGFQFRSGILVAAVLAPVLSALSAMAVFCYISDGGLNMMHLIMGIMVIGLSVDYGIFIVCSKLIDRPTSSAMAVNICAASSIIGFGVLSFAGHPALHALGITVLVGIGIAWPTALFVSPAILTFKEVRR